MRSKEVDKKIRVDIDIEEVKESLEIIKNYAEDMKKNHQYMTNKEQDALQDLNLYINDSTPNQKIRDKIKELEEKKKRYGFGSIESITFLNKIDALKSLLGE